MRITGEGLDAALMTSYFEAWDDRHAYAVSHVGWGMNKAARWEAQSGGIDLPLSCIFLYLCPAETRQRLSTRII